ncbi:MAG TPA: ABC transporter ATP-binding protein [Actinomycetota bacterium]|nr:ABC transporter ATP-binding protein [Actinomycetota bacterium]
MIEVHDVTVAFGRTLALHRVNVQLKRGITGLFGPNASGKSTLLRTLAGLLRPARGRVTIDGMNVDLRDASFRRRIGWAGHATGLYGGLSVRENLELFAALYDASPDAPEQVVSSLGLDEVLDQRASALSAGWQRRAAVARALVHGPQIVLLDEPYANLDDEASEIVSAALKAWLAVDPTERIGVVATHGAKRLKGFADASVVLRRGALASHRVRNAE